MKYIVYSIWDSESDRVWVRTSNRGKRGAFEYRARISSLGERSRIVVEWASDSPKRLPIERINVIARLLDEGVNVQLTKSFKSLVEQLCFYDPPKRPGNLKNLKPKVKLTDLDRELYALPLHEDFS